MPAEPASPKPPPPEPPPGDDASPPIAKDPEDEPRWYLAADGTIEYVSDYVPQEGDKPRDPWEEREHRIHSGRARGRSYEIEDYPWEVPLVHPALIPIPRELVRRVMRGMVEHDVLNSGDSERTLLDIAGAPAFEYSPTLSHFIRRMRLARDRLAEIESESYREAIEKAAGNEHIQASLKDGQQAATAGHQRMIRCLVVWAKLLLRVPLTRSQSHQWRQAYQPHLQCGIGGRRMRFGEVCQCYLPRAQDAVAGLRAVYKSAVEGFAKDFVVARAEIAAYRNPAGTMEALERGIEAERHIVERLRIAEVPAYAPPPQDSSLDAILSPPAGTPDLFALVKQPMSWRAKNGWPQDLRRILEPYPKLGAPGIPEILDRSRFDVTVWAYIGVDPKRTPHLDYLCAWWHERISLGIWAEEELAMVVLLSILQDWWRREGRSLAEQQVTARIAIPAEETTPVEEPPAQAIESNAEPPAPTKAEVEGPRESDQPPSAPEIGVDSGNPSPTEAPKESFFRKVGEAWEISFNGGPRIVLKDGKPLRQLRYLLMRPNCEIDARELVNEGISIAEQTTGVEYDEEAFQLGLGKDEVADDAARKEYLKQLQGFKDRIEDAADLRNLEEVQRLEDEREEFLKQCGLTERRGKVESRSFNDEGDKARKAAGQNFQRALKPILSYDPNLYAHLKAFVAVSFEASYRPSPPVSWDFD